MCLFLLSDKRNYIYTLHISFYLKVLYVLDVQFSHYQVGSYMMMAETDMQDLYRSIYWIVKIQLIDKKHLGMMSPKISSLFTGLLCK